MLRWDNCKPYILTFLYLIVGYVLSVSSRDSLLLQGFYFLFFIVYILLFRRGFSLRNLLVIGVIMRLVLFLHLPNLSDDFYRFFWDGYITVHGYLPYQLLPFEIVSELPNSVLPEIYPYLNSPQYYSVYTPLNQVIFSLPFLFGVDTVGVQEFVFLYRFIFFVLECFLVFKLYEKLIVSQRYLLFFVLLNPLYVLESYSNLHIEFLMGLGLLLALVSVSKKQVGFWLYLSSSLKLITVVFVPFLLWVKQGGRVKNVLSVFTFVVLFLLLNALPFLGGNAGFFESVNLYFQHFEFNASIYFIAREVGAYFVGYNAIAIIGGYVLPLLFSVFYTGVFIQFIRNKVSLYIALLVVFMAYYLLSTTVHPWYIIVPLCLFVVRPSFTCLVWSFTVFFSYQFYNAETNFLYWNIAEYLLLFIAMLIDFRGTRMEIYNCRLKIISV